MTKQELKNRYNRLDQYTLSADGFKVSDFYQSSHAMEFTRRLARTDLKEEFVLKHNPSGAEFHMHNREWLRS